MAYTYDPIFAADPSNAANVAVDASIIIFDPVDPGKAPITITDVTGSPLPNPITVNKNGFGPAFQHATLDRVGWFGAGFTGYFTSYEGMKNVALGAAADAQAAAATAGSEAAVVATAAIGTATDDAEAAAASAAAAASDASASATAAADAAALVGAPADDAIAAAINGAGTATKTALSASILERVEAVIVKTGTDASGPNTEIVGHPSNAIASDITRSVILGGGTNAYNNVIGGDGANVNTVTPNTVTTGTGAHVSVVGGYDNSAGSLSSKIISDHSKTEVGGEGHNAIYGGANCTIKSTAKFAGIFAGYLSEVSAPYGFATGYLNVVSGQSSRASGDHNTVSGVGSTADGTTNTVAGSYASAHGSTNTASGNYSRADGIYAKARTVGQQSFTTGRFTANGDAQTSVIEFHRKTLDATTQTMGFAGGNLSHPLEPNQSVTFNIMVVARVEGGSDSAGFRIEGVAWRGASGVANYVGTPAITALGATAGAATWTVALASDSTGGINVRVTGEAAKTIRWVQRMTLVEVAV